MPTEPIPQPRPRETGGGPPSASFNAPPGAAAGPVGNFDKTKPEVTTAISLPPPAPLGVPREIGPYQIQRLLGSGGMASVYAALQKQPRRTVALKVMKAGIAQSRGEAALRRFKREIEILGKLHHPFIAAVYDAGTFDDGSGPAPYFVMEFIPGATNILEYVAKKEMNLRDRLKLFVKVCAAVEHGHSHKVIHRDLKPGNILIDQYGEPKIIDFGIAHAAELDVSQQTMQTETGNLVGTLQYMAPEQVDTRPQDLDGRCDVYALGVLLYKLTTGKPPYDLEALPVFEAIRIIREERPKRPSEINSEVKGDLETVILKAIEHDRARRYRNAGSLGRDIVRFLANKPINARRASLIYRGTLFAKRNATVLGVIGVIALIALSALAYISWERHRLGKREQALQQRTDEANAAKPAATQSVSTPQPTDTPRTDAFVLQVHTARINWLLFVAGAAAGDSWLVSASSDHSVLVWDLKGRSTRQRIAELGGPVEHLALSAGTGVLAAASTGESGDLSLAHLGAGDDTQSVGGRGSERTSIGLSPDGRTLVWGGSDLSLHYVGVDPQSLRIRESTDNTLLRSTSGAFTAIAFAGKSDLIAAGTQRGTINIMAGRDSSSVQRLPGLKSAIVALALDDRDPAATRMIGVAEDGSAMTWTRGEGGSGGASWSGAPFRAADKPVIAAAFSPSGAYLAIVTADGTQAWAMGGSSGGAPQRIGTAIKSDDTPTAIAIDDQGQWLALGMLNGDVRMTPVEK